MRNNHVGTTRRSARRHALLRVDLDSRAEIAAIANDPTYARYIDFPDQCREALAAARDVFRGPSPAPVSRALVAGMGGSSIAGDFLSALSAQTGKLPVDVVRGFALPAWAGASTLVIACSHSGNTEETLALFRDAQDRGAPCVAVTTGGRLARLATEAGITCLRYDFPSEPRTAFAHIFVRLLALTSAAGIVDVEPAQLDQACRELEALRANLRCEVPADRNDAKRLALHLLGGVPLVIGAAYLSPAARLWKTQLNENAKVFACADELPELHHNTVEGLALPGDLPGLSPILVSHHGFDGRLHRRYALTRELLGGLGLESVTVDIGGTGVLAAMLRAVYLGNLVSYYLARLLAVDPVRTENLNWLKSNTSRPEPHTRTAQRPPR